MIRFFAAEPKSMKVDLTNQVGYIPTFLSEDDPRSAREQFDENYAHGGGWMPMTGWVLDPITMRLKYPGDPAMKPIAVGCLRDELIVVYESGWVAVIQPNGNYEVSRMD